MAGTFGKLSSYREHYAFVVLNFYLICGKICVEMTTILLS